MPSRRATAVIMWQASKQRRGFVRSTAVIHYPTGPVLHTNFIPKLLVLSFFLVFSLFTVKTTKVEIYSV